MNWPYVRPFWRAAALMRLAHLALALLPIAGRVGEGVEQRLAGRLDQPRFGPFAPFGGVEEALVTFVGGDAPLDSCHAMTCS